MVIVNEECDFIIKNYEAIQALKECEQRARDEVPQWISSKLKQILDQREDLGKDWSIEEDRTKDGYNVNLLNKNYYRDGVGSYFCISDLTLEELAATVEDDGCWVYLSFDLSKEDKQEWKWNQEVRDKIHDNRAEIARLGYRLDSPRYSEAVVCRFLLNELNIKALAENPEKTLEKTADIAVKFIKDMSKYLVELPE